VPVDEGIRACLTRFLDNPKFKDIDWIAEAVKDRQVREHTALWEIPSWPKKLNYLLSRYLGASDLIIFLRRCRRAVLRILATNLGGRKWK
jgi:hypothetical protein